MGDGVELPYRVIKLACEMFAESTGPSYNEMDEYFGYQLNVDPAKVEYPKTNNRKERFKFWLNKCSVVEQKRILEDLCSGDISFYHGMPCDEQVERLKSFLEATSTPDVLEGSLKKVDSTSVRADWEKARSRAEEDPDGAITSARSLIESVCKYIGEELGVKVSDDEEMPALFGVISEPLGLCPKQYSEKEFKKILGGVWSIVNGLASLRNGLGDAHGRGKRFVKPLPRHAEFAVNMAGTLSSFLIKSLERKQTAEREVRATEKEQRI